MIFKNKLNEAFHYIELLDSKFYIILTIFITVIASFTFEHIININLDNLNFKFEIIKISIAFGMLIMVMIFLLIFTSYIIKYKYKIEIVSNYRLICRDQLNYIFTEIISKLEEIDTNLTKCDYQMCEVGLLKLSFELNKYYLEIEIFLGNEDNVSKNNAGGFLTIQMFKSLLMHFDKILIKVISVYSEQRTDLLYELINLQKKVEDRIKIYEIKDVKNK